MQRSILVICLSLAGAGACERDAVLAQLDVIREQLEADRMKQARSELRKLAKRSKDCGEDVKAGNRMADLAIRMDEPKLALQLAQLVVKSSAREHGARSIEHAVSLETLAEALAMNRREVEAEPLVREAMSISEQHGGQQSIFHAGLWNLLGTLHARLNDPEGAQRQFERAWRLIEPRAGHDLRVVVLHNLAVIEKRLGREAEAQKHMDLVHRDLQQLAPSMQRAILSWSPLAPKSK